MLLIVTRKKYFSQANSYEIHERIQGVEGQVVQTPLGKLQVAVWFLRNYTGTDPTREAIGPRVQLLLEGGLYGTL